MVSLKSPTQTIEPSKESLLRENKFDKKPNKIKWLLLAVIAVGTILMASRFVMSNDEVVPGIIVTPEGDLALSPERQAKLDKELGEVDNAEQYVLYATANTYYPCFTCPGGQKVIYLQIGQVWRYGITRKGERGRYPNQNYGVPFLAYVPQFWGT